MNKTNLLRPAGIRKKTGVAVSDTKTLNNLGYPVSAKYCRNSSQKASQTGMTLVEIMISLLIGAFLLGGVLQIFVNTKQTYRMQEGLSRLQENGRYALELIGHDTRMSGYTGCGSLSSITPNINAQPPITIFSSATAVNGHNAGASTWSPTLSATMVALAPTSGTDILTLEYGQSCDAQLTGNMTAENANIQVTAPNNCGISASSCGGASGECTTGSVLMISDCTGTDIFRATSASSGGTIQTVAHSNAVNTSNFLSKAYQDDAELMLFNSHTYFVRPGASGQPALWRLDNTRIASATNPLEYVEGIENIQVLYGEDTNQDRAANQYVTANNVGNWANIVSVRISLLARSIDDNLTAQPVDYTYNGATVTPADRRLRRVFNSTIAVRNRLP
ncbi:PilW family protein [Methylotuvimicrobium sp.]|uniref:PilW family protein n=1 Tax=Methylotuvimicrobium sp. TaxID=2822413 RepID=UPI003D659014